MKNRAFVGQKDENLETWRGIGQISNCGIHRWIYRAMRNSYAGVHFLPVGELAYKDLAFRLCRSILSSADTTLWCQDVPGPWFRPLAVPSLAPDNPY
jgi:hypothetical protein